MTELQRKVLKYYKQFGHMNPTYQEVADNVGVTHKQQIHLMVKGFRERGLMKMNKSIKVSKDADL